ncbi:transposase [Streptomyces griseoflavus Tu4000]|uniref:Transposase n=1 Tax=Streptomyces griseoflavus Tu4000 TaxID=467200 RepID=D9XYY2_9ACTN|nr:transposase [Streptomyces griseoflavus Tu4000]
MARIAVRFGRVEPRASARAYLLGLLSKAERKNCWQLAEQAGHARPGPMQRLLRYARWDADAVRDDLRAYAVEHLGADGAVLVVDETGFVKKGCASAGVQRQYTGTAGRIENSQVGVFLAYATSQGRALIDRRLYLPGQSWCTDPERRRAAGIPDEVQFATKPRLAREMIAAALDAGVEAPWVTGDEAYGQDPQLRAALEARGTGYVMAVACSTRVRINHGRTAARADTVAERLPTTAWQRHSAGPGAKGPRHYDWAWIHIGTNDHRHLLVRRNRTTGELAFYLCWSPTEVPLAELVRIAGVRWSVEECFQAAKGQVGLDHYQVRHWTSWHRHITLAMLALAFLTALAAEATPEPPAGAHRLAHNRDPINLTVPEIRHLLVAVFKPPAVTEIPSAPASRAGVLPVPGPFAMPGRRRTEGGFWQRTLGRTRQAFETPGRCSSLRVDYMAAGRRQSFRMIGSAKNVPSRGPRVGPAHLFSERIIRDVVAVVCRQQYPGCRYGARSHHWSWGRHLGNQPRLHAQPRRGEDPHRRIRQPGQRLRHRHHRQRGEVLYSEGRRSLDLRQARRRRRGRGQDTQSHPHRCLRRETPAGCCGQRNREARRLPHRSGLLVLQRSLF